MDAVLLAWPAMLIAGGSVVLHVASAAVAAWRLRPILNEAPPSLPPATVIRPVCGLDRIESQTLASTFRLSATTEIIFCVARETDAAVPFLRRLIAQHPDHNARVLIGHDGPGVNPKLDNVRKGWRAARNGWVVIADSNVLMDETYLWNLLSAWQDDVGAVCAPPFAVGGIGPWAEVETQFLNSYQARWQYAADAVGQGFAQGKSMLFRKSQLERWGDIEALDIDVAEDAATTKVVRRHGYRVRLAARTIPQPLGTRSFKQIWQRQCRWAQLRRQSFPVLHALEPLTMLVPALVATTLGAIAFEHSWTSWCAAVAVIWFFAELLMARSAGWPVSARTAGGAVLRELLLPMVWVAAWRMRPFAWRQPTQGALRPHSA